jgi:hypothetical protein
MATIQLPTEIVRVDATTDVGATWTEAINRYEEITEVKIESLTRASNLDEVLSETQKRETKLRGYCHGETKFDKLRTLLSKSLRPIDEVGSMVASVASAVRKTTLSAHWSAITYIGIAAVLSS